MTAHLLCASPSQWSTSPSQPNQLFVSFIISPTHLLLRRHFPTVCYSFLCSQLFFSTHTQFPKQQTSLRWDPQSLSLSHSAQNVFIWGFLGYWSNSYALQPLAHFKQNRYGTLSISSLSSIYKEQRKRHCCAISPHHLTVNALVAIWTLRY